MKIYNISAALHATSQKYIYSSQVIFPPFPTIKKKIINLQNLQYKFCWYGL